MPKLPKNILQDWNILVIDDEPDSLEVINMILSFYGAKVTVAANGQEGLEAIARERPRFIISDLSMPMVDGWGLIEEMKRNRALSEIPVIALTAHAMIG